MQIKIYLDSGANVKFVPSTLRKSCLFLTFPYDSRSNKRACTQISLPSEATWEDTNITWDESNLTWDDLGGSSILIEIQKIIGSIHRRDSLHLDSAYKEKVDVFLTEDTDILKHRNELEKICHFKIFNTKEILERNEVVKLIPIIFNSR